MPALRTRKGQWLLALLALHPEREARRDELAVTLWPDSDESAALANLRRSLNDLRHALSSEAARLLSPTPRTLRLDLTNAFCDLHAFDVAIRQGDLTSLQTAVSLYRGPLLQGCMEEWALPEREAREQAYLTALERLAEDASSRQDFSAAIGYLRRVVMVETTRESAQRALMQALAASGDQAAVTQAYRAFRLYLHREMHTEPAPETTALYRKLSEAERTVSVATVGRSRLPNLPRPLTPLIGRSQEREEVIRLFGQSRLVTLTGAGGVGKTRLAIAVAEAMRDRYVHGVCFAELASIADSGSVAQVVASTLGVRDALGQSVQDTLLMYLRERELLLVLDNCEHLLAGCVSLAGTLLTGCPGLYILTTSQHSLGLTGENTLRVPSLSVPEPSGGDRWEPTRADLLLEYDAVRLFVERAQAVSSTFHPNHENLRHVVEICRRLDGIPLAIELAAAWGRALSAAEIVHHLEDRFALLTRGNATALPRHQTLEATMDWSYGLLSEEERTLLRRLSVFAGGWTLEAAKQVCSDEEGEPLTLHSRPILDLLAGLVDKSLVLCEEQPDSTVRYNLLETTKQYGAERMKEVERMATRRRHAAYFVSWVERTLRHFRLTGGTDWMERMGREDSNLRTAMDWNMEHNLDAATRLLICLKPYWEYRSQVAQVHLWLTRILESPLPMSLASRAWGIASQGWMARLQGKGDAGLAWMEQGLSLARQAGDQEVLALIARDLGIVAFHRRDYAAARAYFEEGEALFQQIGHRQSRVGCLNLLGQTLWRLGDLEAGKAMLEANLGLAQEIGDLTQVVQALDLLGDLALEQGDMPLAKTFFTRRLVVCRELRDKDMLINALNALGNAAFSSKDYAEARRHYTEGVLVARETTSYGQEMMCLTQLAKVAYAEGDAAAMRVHCAEGLRLAAERLVWDVPLVTRLLCEAGRCAALRGEETQAVCLFGAVAQVQEVGSFALDHLERVPYDLCLTDLKATLREDVCAAAWTKGRAMAWEQAVAFALTSE